MYERMLDKQSNPSFEDLILYSGASGILWLDLDKYIEEKYLADKQIRFPYGNKYGWCVKYSCKNKHICDVFAENNAFTVFMQIKNENINSIINELSDYSKKVWDDKYPCGNGGWVNYRVLSDEQLQDVKIFICAKVKPLKSNH